MSQHLWIISIGPVQEFIASARRSRDLWFGSWLLSELSKAAALRIVTQHQNDLTRIIHESQTRPWDSLHDVL
jgi:CRISPR-associated protein Cmr2